MRLLGHFNCTFTSIGMDVRRIIDLKKLNRTKNKTETIQAVRVSNAQLNVAKYMIVLIFFIFYLFLYL